MSLSHVDRELLTLVLSLSVRLGYEKRVHASDIPDSKEHAESIDRLVRVNLLTLCKNMQYYEIDAEAAKGVLHPFAVWSASLRRLWVADCVYAVFAMNLAFAAIRIFDLLTATFKDLSPNTMDYIGDLSYMLIVSSLTALVFGAASLVVWFCRSVIFGDSYRRLSDSRGRKAPFIRVVLIECIPLSVSYLFLGYFASTNYPAALQGLWPFGIPLVAIAVFLAGFASLQRLWPRELRLASKPLRDIVLWSLLVLAFVTTAPTRDLDSSLRRLFGMDIGQVGGTPAAASEAIPKKDIKGEVVQPGSKIGAPPEIQFVRLACSFAFILSLLWTSSSKLVRILSPWESLQ